MTSSIRSQLEFAVSESEAFKNQGNAYFGDGKLDNAAECYRQAIACNPRYAEAYSNLGFVFQEQGNLDQAIAYYREAVALNPDLLTAHNNLGFALMNLGQADTAEQSFQRVIALAPDHAAALQSLGVIAAQRKDFPRAETLLRRALVVDDDNAALHTNLGHTLKSQGRVSEAAAAYRRAIDFDPSFADAHYSLGNVLQSLGQLQDALDEYDIAISLRANYTDALNNQATALNTLGIALMESGRMKEAETSYRRALQIRPDDAEAHFNLGFVLQGMHRMDEAAAHYRQALQITPDYAEAHNNLGGIFKESGRMDEAETSYRRALQNRSDYAEAHYNLGIVFQDTGRMNEAEASYRRALQIRPDYAEVHNNLGGALKDMGRMSEAEASYRQALRVKPDDANAYSNLLFTLNYHQDKSREEVFAAHREYDERFGLPHREKWPACSNSREPHRRLKVGYVSPDLRQHSVAFFFEPLLREHDRQMVEIFCYAEVAQPDAVTVRLQALADHWQTTVGMSDEALARRIADDEIDILVDLAGHTARNRLLVFARKAAPVQVTWLGYPNSTGLQAMDYRLVDALTDPPGEADALASETLVRLDNGFLCYAAPADAPLPTPPPSLASGSITFGSFNNPAKLSSATLDIWARLLNRVPSSRLLVKGKCFADAVSRTDFLAKLAQRGVDVERVTLLGLMPGLASHLAAYEQVDIALDPFPYNGTTTSCEALWMGVPVVTLLCDRHAGRVGASLLTQIGQTDLIATSTQAYVDIAAALAGDTPRLNKLRRTLRERMAASPLCAPPSFARKMEAAYRDMWRRYCANTDPDGNAAVR